MSAHLIFIPFSAMSIHFENIKSRVDLVRVEKLCGRQCHEEF